MHYPLTDTQADFEINRPVRYRNTAKKIISTYGQADGRTDGQTSRTTTIGSFFRKKEKTTKKLSEIFDYPPPLTTPLVRS